MSCPLVSRRAARQLGPISMGVAASADVKHARRLVTCLAGWPAPLARSSQVSPQALSMVCLVSHEGRILGRRTMHVPYDACADAMRERPVAIPHPMFDGDVSRTAHRQEKS